MALLSDITRAKVKFNSINGFEPSVLVLNETMYKELLYKYNVDEIDKYKNMRIVLCDDVDEPVCVVEFKVNFDNSFRTIKKILKEMSKLYYIEEIDDKIQIKSYDEVVQEDRKIIEQYKLMLHLIEGNENEV